MLPAFGPAAPVNLFCAPAETLSPEALKAMAEIRELLGLTGDEDKKHTQHCDACLVITSLPPPAVMKARLFYAAQNLYCPALSAGFAFRATGPPFGPRAPPTSV